METEHALSFYKNLMSARSQSLLRPARYDIQTAHLHELFEQIKVGKNITQSAFSVPVGFLNRRRATNTGTTTEIMIISVLFSFISLIK